MSNVYGHKKCKSEVPVVSKEVFDVHAHGILNRSGYVIAASGTPQPNRLLHTDENGQLSCGASFKGSLNMTGNINAGGTITAKTITADKIIGAVYA